VSSRKLIPSHDRALDQLAESDRVPPGYGQGVVFAIRRRHEEMETELEIAAKAAVACIETIDRLKADNDRLRARLAN
jgi:hypothetical protein